MDDYKLSNNPLLLIFYKKKTGKELFNDLAKMLKGKQELFVKLQNLKEDSIEQLTDEELNSITEIDYVTLAMDLFYSMRCAYERKELNYYEVIAEDLKMSDLTDQDFLQRLISFAYDGIKKK